MRKGLFLVGIIAVGVGGLFLWRASEPYRDSAMYYAANGEFLTLESRYTAEEIMRAERLLLLPTEKYSYKSVTEKFYPYLLMEVKYTVPPNKTRDGVILWSMIDGEMVLDTHDWRKTHGLKDALNADATRDDFRLMLTLSHFRGLLPKSRLQKEMKLDEEGLNKVLASATRKHLVVDRGNEVQLHFQNPVLDVHPSSKINQWLVSKSYQSGQLVQKKYTSRQIERCAEALFGDNFAIRSSREVFLPCWRVEVLNPDESILTTYWNAITGEPLDEMRFLSQGQ